MKVLWLLQLGTPDSPSTGDVRRYLNEFLMDRRMIALPYPLRLLLVKGIITLFRAPKSAEAYQAVWMKEGGPLYAYTVRLQKKLQALVGDNTKVELGMRYGNPSMKDAWQRIKKQNPDEVILFPLFPQYASSSTGSALERAYELIAKEEKIPSMRVVSDFYEHPDFINCFIELGKEYAAKDYEHVLFSFHGLPEKYLKKAHPVCIAKDYSCCAEVTYKNRYCYRAQSVQTAELIRQGLGIPKDRTTLCFQSRLGPTKWIEPYTDEEIIKLAKKGIKRLAVFCPSFVTDCLETLEEIQIRAKEDFVAAGGHDLIMIPALNDREDWAQAILKICDLQPKQSAEQKVS